MFLKALLVFVPVSIGVAWMHVDPLAVFAVSCLAIIPLADLLAKSTEKLAEFLGPTLGGLLNATLGNAPELIICGLALSKGLQDVVKAAVAGSILMNLLLLLGIAMVAGGLGRERQTFNRAAASMSAALLTLASIGLMVPSLASLGNVAQLISAVRFARNDNMDLAMSTTVGAATQAALAVAPILVFAGRLLGQPMDLLFAPFEVLALALAVMVTGQLTRDGESNWIEGAMLIAVYLIFAMGFYFSG